jgi:putative membrane protein
MTRKILMTPMSKTLVIMVLIVHLMFFILEAIFWMQPYVHDILLYFLDNPVVVDYPVQALTLQKLFINQGFYNLFLAAAGITGLWFVKKEKYASGYSLILFLCCAGAGAGLVLAITTKAYILAFLQAVPAAFAFIKIYPLFKISNDQSKK